MKFTVFFVIMLTLSISACSYKLPSIKGIDNDSYVNNNSYIKNTLNYNGDKYYLFTEVTEQTNTDILQNIVMFLNLKHPSSNYIVIVLYRYDSYYKAENLKKNFTQIAYLYNNIKTINKDVDFRVIGITDIYTKTNKILIFYSKKGS